MPLKIYINNTCITGVGLPARKHWEGVKAAEGGSPKDTVVRCSAG
jgi:hypothetical protein